MIKSAFENKKLKKYQKERKIKGNNSTNYFVRYKDLSS